MLKLFAASIAFGASAVRDSGYGINTRKNPLMRLFVRTHSSTSTSTLVDVAVPLHTSTKAAGISNASVYSSRYCMPGTGMVSHDTV